MPASIDSIPTCAGQEDPVSMAYNASKRAGEAMRKLQYIIAIDIMVSPSGNRYVKAIEAGKSDGKAP